MTNDTQDPCPQPYIDLAIRLVEASGPVVMRYFRGGLDIDDKADASPVTIADREAEAAIRAILEVEVPDHGILGEEHGRTRLGAEWVWVIDPIDGTKSFVTGKPLFGTLIALCRNGSPVLGVIDCPALKERWIGAAGWPTVHNGSPVTVRDCPDLGAAWLYATTPDMFKGADADAFARLRGSVKQAVYGGDCFAYGLLASGFVDLVVESSLQPYDYCALVPVLEGAGGVMTDWQGQALSIDSDGRVIAAVNRPLAEAAQARLAGT